MGLPKEPDPVILFTGMIARDEGLFGLAAKELKKSFGEISHHSPIFPWDHSDYYENEMGKDLKKQFIFFAKPIMPDRIADIKIETNRIEGLFLREGDEKWKRMINIDPGYMNRAKIVLATTKDFSHRIYLRGGIYSEVTLIYKGDSYQPLSCTFPDFRSNNYIKLFNRVREDLDSPKHIFKAL